MHRREDGTIEPARDRLAERFAAVSRGLYRYTVVRLGGDAALADDIMQQVWLEISRNDGGCGVDDWESWLRGVARNLIRQHWRRLQRRAAVLPMADPAVAAELSRLLDREELPDAMLERRDVRDQLLLALTELGADDQELVIRYHFHGQSHQEIAQALQMTPRAVEGRLYRARRGLRDRLAHLREEI